VRFPDQRSVMDQLDELIRLATERGMYDAADWLRERGKLNQTRQTVYDNGFKAGATVGFERGLRRAQELAKEHCRVGLQGGGYLNWGRPVPSNRIDFSRYDQAIDAEVAKEEK
jgi:hypothetical protein